MMLIILKVRWWWWWRWAHAICNPMTRLSDYYGRDKVRGRHPHVQRMQPPEGSGLRVSQQPSRTGQACWGVHAISYRQLLIEYAQSKSVPNILDSKCGPPITALGQEHGRSYSRTPQPMNQFSYQLQREQSCMLRCKQCFGAQLAKLGTDTHGTTGVVLHNLA